MKSFTFINLTAMKTSACFLPLLLSIILINNTFAQNKSKFAERADRYIQPYVETNNFSGVVLVAKDGNVIFEKAYGNANYELNVSNNLQTVFHIASVSKTFTAASILLLEQRGLLATEDLLSKYIPDFPSGEKITVHHLLAHTSGITNVNDLAEYTNAANFPQTPESLIALFKNKPLEFEPGAKYQYSNSNYNVLAFIIERVSGKKYGEFLNDSFFQPLGMKSTFHHQDACAIVKNAAEGYASDGNFGLQKSPYLDWSSKTGNGSIATTVHDLLLWDQALYGEKVLSAKAKTKMFTPYVGSGYGWYLRKRFEKNSIYMNGRSPGFCSHLGRYPDEKLTVIVLENNYVATANPIGIDLAGIYFNQPVESPDLKLSKTKPEDAKEIIGKYRFGSDFYRPDYLMTVTEKDGFLFTDWGELIPGKSFEFVQRAYWSKIKFMKNDQGKITSMSLDNYSGKRVE